MVTTLTLNQSLFSNSSDLVDPVTPVLNQDCVSVNTLKGNDQIIGTYNIVNPFILSTNKTDNSDNANASVTINSIDPLAALENRGTILTGNGADRIVGKTTVNAPFDTDSVSGGITIQAIATAIGQTSATASATVNISEVKITGILNSGTINTGNDNDEITGESSITAIGVYTVASAEATANAVGANASANAVSINAADVNVYGILNQSGNIITGNGNDKVIGRAFLSSNAANDYRQETSASAGGTGTSQATSDRETGKIRAYGIFNSGKIDTGTGNDEITGSSEATNITAYGIENSGTIFTGNGNDEITGITTVNNNTSIDTVYGIYNSGTIDAGTGNDKITGTATATNDTAYGIKNLSSGTIDVGNGDDKIIGTAISTNESIPYAAYGIDNSGRVLAGAGNDEITGTGTVNNTTSNTTAYGINNSGIIDAGNGDDKITGTAAVTDAAYGIFNEGTIDGGAGNDKITGTATCVFVAYGIFVSPQYIGERVIQAPMTNQRN